MANECTSGGARGGLWRCARSASWPNARASSDESDLGPVLPHIEVAPVPRRDAPLDRAKGASFAFCGKVFHCGHDRAADPWRIRAAGDILARAGRGATAARGHTMTATGERFGAEAER